MIEQLLRTECCGCYACYNACPVECITMKKNEEGFFYPYVAKEQCIECKKCEMVCPMEVHTENCFEKKVFAACALDNNERMHSSSGAIFPLLAKYVLKRNGCVFGATFNEAFEVEHKCVENINELAQLRGTKYVQSQINNSYLSVKKKLKDGKLVLFSGTPCQVAGLTQYLGKEYENLITLDVICHGVPAPGVWEEYLKCRVAEANSNVHRVSFRDQKESWEQYSLKIDFLNGKIYRKRRREDLYLIGFLDDIYLRKSCYSCQFKGNNRTSDLTLGDFWGIEQVCSDMDDDKGVSVIIVNSTKGKAMFEKIEDEVRIEEVDIKTVSLFNPSYDISVEKTEKRRKFYKKFKKKSFDKSVKHAIQEPLIKRLKSCIYNIVR